MTKRILHHWIEEERDILRQRYDGTSISVCSLSKEFSVTPEAVRNQARRLGLTPKWLSCKRWTKEDDFLLTELIGQVSVSEIARRFSRSRGAVENRIKLRGLNRRSSREWLTAKEVARTLGVNPHRITNYISYGALRAVRHNGGSANDVWHISTECFRDFIRNYSTEFAGRNVDLFTIVHLFDKEE